jgi:peptidoglycan/xylan/chitin deacetylase (PgdA/CDA1 family)
MRVGTSLEPVGVPLVLRYRGPVSERWFERQLRWLRRAGLRGVSMRELLAARPEGRAGGLVGLTFDDGCRDFAAYAMPALERYGCTATVFIVAGPLGRHHGWDERGPRYPRMTANQVRQLAQAGIEIGSHGLHHISLSTAGPAVLDAEVRGSRALLRELTGQDVAGFCYPYGHVSAGALVAVRSAGYDYACAVSGSSHTGRYTLPRTTVGERDGPLRLSAKWARHRMRWGGAAR